MDPLAHTLVGAALAETRLKRWTALAAPTLIIAANLPDVDVVSYAWGEATALSFRRGWTHGIAALGVLPLVLTAAMVGWRRWVEGRRQPTTTEAPGFRPWAILALATLGVATHPLLDWLNTYGIRWLMPFDGRWFYGDTLFIVDPWLWLLLGGAVFLARSRGVWALGGWVVLATLATLLLCGWAFVPPLSKAVWAIGIIAIGLVRALRGPRSPSAVSGRLATTALALTVAYIVAMNVAGHLAVRTATRRLTMGGVGPITRLMAGPLPADPLGRDIVAERPSGYWTGTLRWHRTPPLIAGRPPIGRGPDDAAVRAAAATPEVRAFLGWARFPFVEVDTTLRGFTVYFLDARYARTRSRQFGSAVIDLDRDLVPLAALGHPSPYPDWHQRPP